MVTLPPVRRIWKLRQLWCVWASALWLLRYGPYYRNARYPYYYPMSGSSSQGTQKPGTTSRGKTHPAAQPPARQGSLIQAGEVTEVGQSPRQPKMGIWRTTPEP